MAEELIETSTTEAPSTPDTGSIETSAPESTASAHSEGAPAIEPGAEGAAAAEPAYTPNLKFKFTDEDGEKEAEFDDWVRPFITKETEEKFRDVFSQQKAFGFMKGRRDKAVTEKTQFESDYNKAKGVLTDWLGLREKDLGLFFEQCGVTEERLAQYLVEKHQAQEKLKDLPEPLRNLYTENVELKRRLTGLEKQFGEAEHTGHGAVAQTLSLQVQTILNRPDLASAVSDFDARRGKPGSFFEMVRREGEIEFARSKTNLTAEEAVQRAFETLALNPQVPSQGTTPNAGAVATPKVVIQGKTQVIPNVGGGSATVGAKQPRSLDDLRRMAKEMSASNRA